MRGELAIVLVLVVDELLRRPPVARVAGEFYVNAIHVMRGAEAVSTYSPIDEAEKFRIEYRELEEAKLRRRPTPIARHPRRARDRRQARSMRPDAARRRGRMRRSRT